MIHLSKIKPPLEYIQEAPQSAFINYLKLKYKLYIDKI